MSKWHLIEECANDLLSKNGRSDKKFQISELEKKLYKFILFHFLGYYEKANELYSSFSSRREYSYGKDKGVILIGDYGVGKDFLFKVIQRVCLERDTRFSSISSNQILTEYKQGTSSEKSLLVDKYSTDYTENNFHKNLLISDLGKEIAFTCKKDNIILYDKATKCEVCGGELQPQRIMDYQNPITTIEDIIFNRHELFISNSTQTHFTTNHSIQVLSKIYGARIGDRIPEMCNVIEWRGVSKRRN